MKNQIALVVAVVLAILAVIAVRTHLENVKEQTAEESERMGVVVAKRDIEKDEPLTPDVIERGEVPPKTLHGMNLIPWSERHTYLNTNRLQKKIAKGKYITRDMLLPATIKSLSSGLSNGERAITIAVDQVSGVSGYLSPGDHIDIYATFTVPGPAAGGARQADVKTYLLLSNVRILKTGVKAAPVRRRRFSSKVTAYTTVTLRVREQAAHMLAFSQSQGRLVLTLRPAGDTTGPASVIMDMETLSKLLQSRPRAKRK
jgi:pilus assembly protein CpaB